MFPARSLAFGLRPLARAVVRAEPELHNIFRPAYIQSTKERNQVTTRVAARYPIHTTAISLAKQNLQHFDTPDNNPGKPFEFDDENKEKIKAILEKYPDNYKQSAVISLLWMAQWQIGEDQGWLPISKMYKCAEVMEIPPMRVFEVATFYTMFNRKPIGKWNLQVCTTTPCMCLGAYDVLAAVKDHLNVEVGGDTEDGLFHLMEVECLGACVNAPMMQINGPTPDGKELIESYFEDLTPETTIAIIEDLKAGRMPKKGPQNGREGCIGPIGKTSLFEEPPGPFCRNLDEEEVKEKN